MYTAPSLEKMRCTLKWHQTEIIGVLFAPPYTTVGRENIVPRLVYLDRRTGQHIHFFCAGYGEYQFADDCIPVGEMWYDNGVMSPWYFSQRKFAEFVDELEGITSWQYSGEADLILARSDLKFNDCIVYDIEAMVKDGAIARPSQLFEAIIKYARDRKEESSVGRLSDKEGFALLRDAAVEGILSLIPNPFRNLWKRGIHYRTQDLSKV
jgi:hypothetical protein